MNQGASHFWNDPGFYKSDVEEPHAKPLTKDFLTEPGQVARIEQESDMGELWKDTSKENNLNFKTLERPLGKLLMYWKISVKIHPCYYEHATNAIYQGKGYTTWKTEYFVSFQ